MAMTTREIRISRSAAAGAGAVALLALLGPAACLDPNFPPSQDGVRVGVLLPYTGELATVGQNLERAVILANERLAQSEPSPSAPPFRLIFRDTHSDVERGKVAAQQLIAEEKVTFLLGPEEPALAEAMAPLFHDKAVAITGGAVSLDSPTLVNDWFRIVPTAKRMGGALADQMVADGVRSLAIIYDTDTYGQAFANLAAAELKARGRTVSMMAPLVAKGSNGTVVRTVVAAKPDAILLVAYPIVGAAVVQEWAILGSAQRWYFAPSLRSEVFALNLPPGLTDPMVGISAGLPADARNFANEFKARWRGEEPAPNAHYYFDAMMLSGMAYRAAVQAGSVQPTSAELGHRAACLLLPSG